MRLGMFACASGQFGVCVPWTVCLQGRRMGVLVFVSKDRCRLCKEEIIKADPTLCREGSLWVLANCSGDRWAIGKGLYTGFMMK